jgi:hypothetical protein
MPRFINIFNGSSSSCIFTQLSSETTIVFFNCEFLIIKHDMPISKIDFIEAIFKNLNVDKIEKLKTERGIVSDKKLRDLRIRNINLQSSFDEINYIYQSNSGKEFCFYTQKKFTKNWLNEYNQKLEIEVEKTIELLKEKNIEHLKKEVLNLAKANKIYDFTTQEELYKTINHFTKKLRNHETS